MWENEEALSIEEKRQRYRCRSYITLADIPTFDTNIPAINEKRKKNLEKYQQYLEEEKKKELEKQKRQAEMQKNREAREEKRKQLISERNALDRPAHAENQDTSLEIVQRRTIWKLDQDVRPKTEAINAKLEELDDESEAEGSDSSDSDDYSYRRYNRKPSPPPDPEPIHFAHNAELMKKVSLIQADITSLEIDAIVNAANRSLLGGGGIDGAIHSAAGDDLYYECKQLDGCQTGGCKITRGYRLPAKYILHTVGPVGENKPALVAAYKNCLRVAVRHNVRVIAFCGISSGIYGYPLYEASRVALDTIRKWLETGDNKDKVDRIIFCTFLDKEIYCYEHLMPAYFPPAGTVFTPGNEDDEEDEEEFYVQPESEEEDSDEEDEKQEDEEDQNDEEYEEDENNVSEGDGEDNDDDESGKTDVISAAICNSPTAGGIVQQVGTVAASNQDKMDDCLLYTSDAADE
eukprot:TRINITY_DN513_c0_g1_i1.p1 TRINITY_DN513_c0_g1~~TRINITY_DN513_c0_g1_i1.p1  ORF type:complete len:462 (-),score=118.48 TRINITY_DN513_c0_g1_i1:18-1403(-)